MTHNGLTTVLSAMQLRELRLNWHWWIRLLTEDLPKQPPPYRLYILLIIIPKNLA